MSAPPPPTPLQPVSFPSPPPPETRHLWVSELLLRNHPDILCRWLSTAPACFPAGCADPRPWHLGAPQGAFVRFGSLVTCHVQARSGFGRLGAVAGPLEQARAVCPLPPRPLLSSSGPSWASSPHQPDSRQAARTPPPMPPLRLRPASPQACAWLGVAPRERLGGWLGFSSGRASPEVSSRCLLLCGFQSLPESFVTKKKIQFSTYCEGPPFLGVRSAARTGRQQCGATRTLLAHCTVR